MTGLTFSGTSTLFALTLAGVYRSLDNAVTWTAVNPPSPNSIYYGTRLAVLQPPCAPLLAGAGSRIVLSSDAGATWSPGPFADVTDIAAGPGCVLYASRRLSGDGFAMKLTPGGEVLWSTYLGGSGRDSIQAAATDSSGNLYLTGQTDSPDFPGGAADGYATFLTKLSPEGSLLYSRVIPGTNPARLAADPAGNAYLVTIPRSDGPTPGSYIATKFSVTGDVLYAYPSDVPMFAITANSQGIATITTRAGILRLDAGGQPLDRDETSPYRNAAILLTDSQDNTYFIGSTGAAETRSHPCPRYTNSPLMPITGDTFVALQSPGRDTAFSTVLAGECPAAPVSAALTANGIVLSLITQSNGFPLRYPAAAAGLSPTGVNNVILSLSSEGTVDFATYTNATAAGPVTMTGDGIHTVIDLAVTRLAAPAANIVALHGVNNAFSQASNGISPGSLVALTGDNLGPDEAVDYGFDSKVPLPVESAGTAVLFDDEPARILRVSRNLVIAVAPQRFREAAATEVRVVRNGVTSNTVMAAVRPNVPQLLAGGFPDVDIYAESPDGAVLNAAPGTNVTLVLTGTSNNILYSSLDNYTAPIAAQPVPGLIDSIRQITVPVTASTFSIAVSPNPSVRFTTPVLASRPVTVHVR